MDSLPKYAMATVDLFKRLYKPNKAETLMARTGEDSMQSSKYSLAASARGQFLLVVEINCKA